MDELAELDELDPKDTIQPERACFSFGNQEIETPVADMDELDELDAQSELLQLDIIEKGLERARISDITARFGPDIESSQNPDEEFELLELELSFSAKKATTCPVNPGHQVTKEPEAHHNIETIGAKIAGQTLEEELQDLESEIQRPQRISEEVLEELQQMISELESKPVSELPKDTSELESLPKQLEALDKNTDSQTQVNRKPRNSSDFRAPILSPKRRERYSFSALQDYPPPANTFITQLPPSCTPTLRQNRPVANCSRLSRQLPPAQTPSNPTETPNTTMVPELPKQPAQSQHTANQPPTTEPTQQPPKPQPQSSPSPNHHNHTDSLSRNNATHQPHTHLDQHRHRQQQQEQATTSSWVYSLQRSFRQYQFAAVHKSLFTNTLLCLPPTAGALCVGAVLLANHARWFGGVRVGGGGARGAGARGDQGEPWVTGGGASMDCGSDDGQSRQEGGEAAGGRGARREGARGIAVFVSPRKARLVQMSREAELLGVAGGSNGEMGECFGVKQDDVIVISGDMNREQRIIEYAQRSVILAEVAVLVRDMRDTLLDLASIKFVLYGKICIMLDEAHIAQGSHYYCEIRNILSSVGAVYRSVGLTMSPGVSLRAVQSLILNLNISELFLLDRHDPIFTKFQIKESSVPMEVNDKVEAFRIRIILMTGIAYLQKNMVGLLANTVELDMVPDDPENLTVEILRTIERSFRANQSDHTEHTQSSLPGLLSSLQSLLFSKQALEDRGIRHFSSIFTSLLLKFTTHPSSPSLPHTRDVLLHTPLKSLVDALRLFDMGAGVWAKVLRVRGLLGLYFGDRGAGRHVFGGACEGRGSTGTSDHRRQAVGRHGSGRRKEADDELEELEALGAGSGPQGGDERGKGRVSAGGLAQIQVRRSGESRRWDPRATILLVGGRKVALEIISGLDGVAGVRAGLWVGASFGNKMSDNDRAAVLDLFRRREINTLIMTGVTNEFFDLDPVHLFICFDVGASWMKNFVRENKSPLNRTGKGIVLLTKNEHSVYRAEIDHQKALFERLRKVTKSRELKFYSFNPRLVPEGIIPTLKYEGKFKPRLQDQDDPIDEIEDDVERLLAMGELIDDDQMKSTGTPQNLYQ